MGGLLARRAVGASRSELASEGWKPELPGTRFPRPMGRLPHCLALLVAACGTVSPDSSAQPVYASDAAINMKRGNDALKDKQYSLSERYFEYVKAKYPFVDASREAELRLAD